MRDEYISATDRDGKPLDEPVLRSEAHRQGIWHRSVSIFVLNRLGEILMECRSDHKDLAADVCGLGSAVDPADTLQGSRGRIETASEMLYAMPPLPQCN